MFYLTGFVKRIGVSHSALFILHFEGLPFLRGFHPQTWTHNELRDEFNTVEKTQADPRFQKFLRWLYKQQEGTFFRTRRNRTQSDQPYR